VGPDDARRGREVPPAVVPFCYWHGLTLQYGFNDADHIEARLEETTSEIQRVSQDPLRARVTTEMAGDSMTVELDGDLSVTVVEE
jgi:hypothetical protein